MVKLDSTGINEQSWGVLLSLDNLTWVSSHSSLIWCLFTKACDLWLISLTDIRRISRYLWRHHIGDESFLQTMSQKTVSQYSLSYVFYDTVWRNPWPSMSQAHHKLHERTKAARADRWNLMKYMRLVWRHHYWGYVQKVTFQKLLTVVLPDTMYTQKNLKCVLKHCLFFPAYNKCLPYKIVNHNSTENYFVQNKITK